MATETEIRIKGSVDPSVAKAANDAAKTVQDSVEKAQGGKGAAGAGTPSGAGNGLSKAQQAAQFQAQVMLQKLGKLQEGLAGKSSMTAKALSSTIGQIEELSKSGSINASVIAKMTAMYEDFIRNSVELPPDELVDLSKEITAAKTALEKTLKVMDAAVPEVKVEVSADGLKNVESLQHKLEVIGAAKDLDRGLLALEVAAQKTSETVRNRLGKEIGKIREMMSKPLGKGAAEQFEKYAKSVASIIAEADASDITKVGDASTSVISSLNGLKSATNTGARALSDLNDVWQELTSAVSGGTENSGMAIDKLIKKFPLLGMAIERVNGIVKGFGPGLMVAATGFAGMMAVAIQKVGDLWIAWRELKDRTKTAEIESNFAIEASRIEAMDAALKRSIDTENMRIGLLRKEVEATNALRKAKLSLAKVMVMTGEMPDFKREGLEREFNKKERQQQLDERNSRLDLQLREANNRMRDIERRNRVNFETIKNSQNRSQEYGKIAGNKPTVVGSIVTGGSAGMGTGLAAGSVFGPIGSAVAGTVGGIVGAMTGAAVYGKEMDIYFKNLKAQSDEINAMTERIREGSEITNEWFNAQEEQFALIDEQNMIEIERMGNEAEAKDDESKEKIRQSRERLNATLEREIEAMSDTYAIRDKSIAERKQAGLVSYEDEKKYVGDELDAILPKLQKVKNEWIALRDSYNGKAQGEWEKEDVVRIRMLERQMDLLKGRKQMLESQNTMLIYQGGDIEEYQWQRAQDKRMERIGDEARQRQMQRNARLGGPMAGIINEQKEGRLMKERADEEQKVLDEIKKKYTDIVVGKDGSKNEVFNFRKLKANQLDYQKFMDSQTWMDQYRSAQYSAEESMKQRQDERNERFGQWRLDNMKQGNRLTAMGLGGDVADFNKQTAGNTKELVTLTREMLKTFSGGMPGKRLEAGIVKWSM